MSLPNLLTILRILLIPVFINFLLYNQYLFALTIFIVAGLTDSLDGFIARMSNQRTRLGAYLDPMADKFLLMAAFVALSILKIVPLWITIIVVSRDLILLLGALILHLTQIDFPLSPTLMGKATTVFQIICVGFLVFLAFLQEDVRVVNPLVWATLCLTVVSGLHYLYRFVRVINGQMV